MIGRHRNWLWPTLWATLPVTAIGAWMWGLEASDESLIVALAAVNEVPDARRLERLSQLSAIEAEGRYSAFGWHRLASEWNVCHRLWPQAACRMPPGPYEAEGLVKSEISYERAKAQALAEIRAGMPARPAPPDRTRMK